MNWRRGIWRGWLALLVLWSLFMLLITVYDFIQYGKLTIVLADVVFLAAPLALFFGLRWIIKGFRSN